MVNVTHTRRSEKSSNFDEMLYTAADFELDERHVIRNEKVALDRLPSSTERISCCIHVYSSYCKSEVKLEHQ